MNKLRKHIGLIIAILMILLLASWPIVTGKPAAREVVFTILKAIALASSLNIILGYTGYVSFGNIVFFGMGGYVGFYLISEQGWHLYPAMILSGLASGLLAFLLGKAILRLRGAYFALATIGVNQAALAIIKQIDLVGGPIGMTLNFRVYDQYGGATQALQLAFYTMLAITLLTILVSYLIKISKFGLGLFAIREDEDAAEVMGVVAPTYKTWAYVASSVFPGMVGALFFFKNATIEPPMAFHLHTSIELLVMVMLGGYGTVLGPIVGAAGYQRLRGLLVTTPIFKNVQLAVAGVLLLIIILFVPDGIVGWIRKRFPNTRRVLQ